MRQQLLIVGKDSAVAFRMQHGALRCNFKYAAARFNQRDLCPDFTTNSGRQTDGTVAVASLITEFNTDVHFRLRFLVRSCSSPYFGEGGAGKSA